MDWIKKVFTIILIGALLTFKPSLGEAVFAAPLEPTVQPQNSDLLDTDSLLNEKLEKAIANLHNVPPTLSVFSSATQGIEPLYVQFNAFGYDPEGDKLTYSWSFSDGSQASESSVPKIFEKRGIYNATASVYDGINTVKSTSIQIQVGLPPTVAITTSLETSNYTLGQAIDITIAATDASSSAVPEESVSSSVQYIYNDEIIHTEATASGKNRTLTIADTELGRKTQRVDITATATDKDGLTTSTTIQLYPQKSWVTLASSTPGLSLVVNGKTVNSEYAIEQLAGQTATVSAISPQILEGTTYIFDRWDDGNTSRERTIQAPDSNTTFTAVYTKSSVNFFLGDYFDNPTLTGTPVFSRPDAGIAFDWKKGSPDSRVPQDNFSVRWTTSDVFEPGVYRFTTKTDDGVRLKVNGQTVIDAWNNQPATEHTAEITLFGGTVPIIAEYYDATDTAFAYVTWERIGAVSQVGWQASYFDTASVSGTPVITRFEPVLDFQWGEGSPDFALPVDQFAASFERSFTIETEADYEFTVRHDDGMKLYLDGTMIYDSWQATSFGTSFKKSLSKGLHTVTVEYREDYGTASLFVDWQEVTDEQDKTAAYTAFYYDNPTLSGFPAAVREDQQIDFHWGFSAPEQNVPRDNFSARWEKTTYFEGGTYKFSVRADDGVRLFIDDTIYIDRFAPQRAQTISTEVVLPAGPHSIRLEYFERTGTAAIQMTYEKTADLPDENVSAVFYNSTDLSGPVVYKTTYPSFDVDWGTTSPDARVSNDGFSGRMTKTAQFQTGTYRFTVQSDDGIRVFLDGQSIFSAWKDQSPTGYTFFQTIEEGVHTLTVEYYEQQGTAKLAVRWELTQETAKKTPQFKAEYFANTTLSGDPRLSREDEKVLFQWGQNSPDPSLPQDNFSVRWTKKGQFAAGVYRFSAQSDDNVRIYIDDVIVVDAWDSANTVNAVVDVPLSPGEKTIRIEYKEKTGNAGIDVSWQKK